MKKKIFTILFALSLILALCLVANADDYTEWTVSSDGSTLIVDDKTYTLYDGYLFNSDTFLPEVKFVYKQDYVFTELKRNTESLDIFYFEGDIFVSNNGKNYLDDFVSGKFSQYKISSQNCYHYMNITSSWVNSLDGGDVESFDVRELQAVERYYVLGYDKTVTMAHTIGAIYYVDGSYYFINYDKLPNNYFDSYGDFSYRGGTVNAYKLNTVQESDMDGFDLNKVSYKSEFERDKSSESRFGKGFFVAVFIIVTVIFGYAIPLVPAVIGAIRITKGKTKNPKRWYLILILCALWILLATLILFAMIF